MSNVMKDILYYLALALIAMGIVKLVMVGIEVLRSRKNGK